jgi:tetratricopeptide (TPR) repeat protein
VPSFASLCGGSRSDVGARSPYNRHMRTIIIGFLCGTFFFVGPLAGLSQEKETRGQQIESHRQKAAEALQSNRPDLAAAEFRAILAIDPNNVDAHGNLGAVLFFQGAYSEAVPELKAALRLRPGLWKTQALLGIGEKRIGKIAEAHRDLEKAFPNVSEPKIRTQTGMELIELYSSTGELEKAATVVGTLRRLEPTDGTILYTAYRVYSDLADESLLSLSVVDPNSARMHQAMAHELAKRGNTAEAIENYRTALKLDPQLPGIHFELAEMLNTLGTSASTQEAESEYKAALLANPRDEQSERRLGDIALQANDLQKAEEHYSRALELQPNDPDANVGLAKVCMSRNDPQKAEVLLRHALDLDPTNATAHYRLGTVYRQTGRTADAKRELEDYQKYRKMKEKLRDVYRDLHREPVKDESDDPNSAN